MAEAEFPDKLQVLFEPARYKVLYGGRGGAKSWGIARALVILAARQPLRVLCAREIQKSMRESVHQLLRDQIKALGLDGFYTVLNDEIRGANGSTFIFAGLRHNVDSIKSKEGLDIVWIEEAQSVSKNSWDTLIPTIRKEGSEIWISFNPALDTDETYKRFVLNPPAGAVVVKIGWQDNNWFPAVLDQERIDLQAKDPDAYLTVWEGYCKQVLDGAIYANEIRAATSGNRITSVPYDPAKPVSTFWDLGRRDLTSIWFAQVIGFEPRLIDYYQNRGHHLAHFLKALQDRPYIYAEHHLPHDGNAELLGAQRTIAEQMRDAGHTVRDVPKLSVEEGINAARTIFPRCWFDQEKTADGLSCLRHYRYEVDPDTGHYSAKPLHDDYSNGADAFRYFAVSLSEPTPKRERKPRRVSSGGWMGA